MKLQERHLAALDTFERDQVIAEPLLGECIWLTLLTLGPDDRLRLTEHGRLSLVAYRRALRVAERRATKGWRRWLPGPRAR